MEPQKQNQPERLHGWMHAPMPLRPWVLIVALGWVVAVTLVLSPESGAQTSEQAREIVENASSPQDGAATSAGQSNQNAQNTTTPPSIQDHSTVEEPCGARCQAAEQREQSDLEAQRSMAKSTAEMVSVTWKQFWVGIAAVLLVGITILYTRRASRAAKDAVKEAEKATVAALASVDEARKATRAAEETTAVTRGVAKAQLRAYVCIDWVRREKNEIDNLWEVHIRIKNFGQTPAYNMQTWVGKALMNPDDANFDSYNQLPTMNQGTWPPNHPYVVRMVLNEIQNEVGWMKFTERKELLYIWGRVEYVDIFDNKCFTDFRLSQTFNGAKEFATCEEGNQTDRPHVG